ncbi:hypothetical protein TNCV_4469861 [Trichonephila clavipes]|nr:hypothetical protein TNCV_4469861 [Trichonephila clavipes]
MGDAKIKEGIFVSPRICKIMKDPAFDQILEGKEKAAWEAFKSVLQRFLDSKEDENYQQLTESVLKPYETGDMIEEVVDLATQINLNMDSDDV